ncbi:MAG: transposase family protein [Pseudonocardiaceae bacterium]
MNGSSAPTPPACWPQRPPPPQFSADSTSTAATSSERPFRTGIEDPRFPTRAPELPRRTTSPAEAARIAHRLKQLHRTCDPCKRNQVLRSAKYRPLTNERVCKLVNEPCRYAEWLNDAITGQVLRKYVPTADEHDARTRYVVDGTLLPCWSWALNPGLYSGKHKTTGMNVQVACTLDGDLAWISDPVEGSRHDTYCLSESGVLQTLDPGNWVGDRDTSATT